MLDTWGTRIRSCGCLPFNSSPALLCLTQNRRFLRKRHSRVGKRSSADDVKASKSDLTSVSALCTRGQKRSVERHSFYLLTIHNTDAPTNIALQYWESLTEKYAASLPLNQGSFNRIQLATLERIRSAQEKTYSLMCYICMATISHIFAYLQSAQGHEPSSAFL